MSIERVKDYFRKHKMEQRIQEFETSSATVELAAAALKCEPMRIAKTLSFMVGDAKVDNQKFKTMFGVKAKMLSPDEVEHAIGHGIGGVCPFGIKEGVRVYLDCSLKRFQTVFPACGSSNSAIELSISEMEEYSNYIEWVDVCKEWAA